MSNNVVKRNPTGTKSKKPIPAKVDSGIARMPSTTTRTESPQHSRLPRPLSGRQSSRSIQERKAATGVMDKTRPTSSGSFNRFTSQSKSDEKSILKVHRLGMLPTYLRKPRSASFTEKNPPRSNEQRSNEAGEHAKEMLEFVNVRFEKFQNDLAIQYGKYCASKEALNEEGITSSDVRNNISVQHASAGLEEEIARVFVQTEPVEAALQTGVCPPFEGSGGTPMEATVLFDQQQQLTVAQEKNHQLEIMCAQQQERIENLEKEVATKGAMISKMENGIDEMRKISNAQNSQMGELEQRLADALKICEDKDNQILELNTNLETVQKQKSLVDHRNDEALKMVVTLQTEVERLQRENRQLIDNKQQNDIQLKIRAQLLESLEASNQSLIARCAELDKPGVKNEVEAQAKFEISRTLHNILSVEQSQRSMEKQNSSVCDQKSVQSKVVSHKILDVLRQMKNENLQLRGMIENKCVRNKEERVPVDNLLNKQSRNKLCQLFPEELPSNDVILEDDVIDEQITNRIVYDDQITGKLYH
ncbi:polyamine-modulated factor 1-binding protein 1-like isoform X2 [Toxorhynchites rutilus septentrionalis]|uniref:polyamine-modulated factor 1-binding protein 1-like isoform X2 n=1 Tax=Toxorhynchites rutilus septentrionalis TaxID=329112 RepID=UPI00247A4870|nr:polyamine-modulated factor 1-binding protein 1-like isoform X2 [Toxorhynchites rutilus septentrionalis]